MNGYKVLIYKVTEKPPEDAGYCRENSEQIYEQKVEDLDVQAIIAVVNGLNKP